MSTKQELATMDEELNKDMMSIQDSIGASSSTQVRLTNKKFVLPDGQESEGPLHCVIIGHVSRNMFYANAYDPNNIESPTCFSISEKATNMEPSKNSSDKQSDECSQCPMNQFGSDGNGKACKNQRHLALLPLDQPDAEIMTITVAPSAIRGFDSYINRLVKLNTHPVKVITTINFDESVTYAKLLFDSDGVNGNIPQHWARKKEAMGVLLQEPTQNFEEEEPAKKVTKKRASRARK